LKTKNLFLLRKMQEEVLILCSSSPCRISWAGISTGLPVHDGDGCQGFLGPDPSTLLDEYVKLIVPVVSGLPWKRTLLI